MTVRYGLEGTCPKCEKETRFSRVTSQRAYACQWCGHHTYPCVGTPFESSRTSLQLWFYAIYLFTTTRSGVSAKELQRQLGVTYKCAWRMGHEIRKHMGFVDGDEPLSGHVEADEGYFGGNKRDGRVGRAAPKTVIFGMVSRGGDIMLRVVPKAHKQHIMPLMAENITKGTTISTDENRVYNGLDHMGYKHDTVNHGMYQYVKGETHTNTIEQMWGRLKASIRGTHIWVSAKHLDKYSTEFEYRYNSRLNPDAMFPELVSTFAPLKK